MRANKRSQTRTPIAITHALLNMCRQNPFINAFFNSWLFRIERLILKLTLKKPATDQDITKLANGTSNTMTAWRIEQRDDNQILLEVPDTPIRTWLMREDAGDHTNLYFGIAILPMRTDKMANLR